MKPTKRRASAVLALALGLSLVAAGCGNDDDSSDAAAETTVAEATETTEATTDAAEVTEATEATDATEATEATEATTAEATGSLSGEIVVSGSSTVEPISAAVATKFSAANPDVAVSVEGPGTGDGFAKFCAGETDIADASRPIKAEEAQTCEGNGITFVELKVAVDGLSVITSAQNSQTTCLSFVDLYALLGPDATGTGNWKDATARADEHAAAVTDLGQVHTPYPDAPLTVTAPGEESGTFDSFVEIVIAPVGAKLGVEDATVRPDYTASPNDNVIVEGIAANPTSLGWVGFAFVEENLSKIKPLQVDGGAGCIEPTPATIASGEYPIARDLFIYVNADKAQSNPALAGYVDFYVSQIGDGGVVGTDVSAGQVPYVPLAAADLDATRSRWEARTVGTAAG